MSEPDSSSPIAQPLAGASSPNGSAFQKGALTLGLRRRLILLLLAAFAAIFTLIVSHMLQHGEDALNAATHNLLDDANLIVARQATIVAKADALLNDLATRSALRPGAPAGTCDSFLASHIKGQEAFANILKLTPSGDAFCTAAPRSDPVNYADRRWFAAVLQTEDMVVSEVLTGRILKRPAIVFARAQRDAEGRLTSVLAVLLSLDWLGRELGHVKLPQETRLVVVDADGTVVARHPEGEDWVGNSVAQSPVFQAVVARGGHGTLEAPGLNGVPRIVAFTPLLNTVAGPAYLWLSVPKAVVTAPVQRALWISLAMAGTVLFLLLGAVIWGGEKLLVQPLLKLSRALNRFGDGDFATRTGLPHGGDDIGRLARAFDAMADSVQAGEQSLIRANRALRVLSAGNQTLLHASDEPTLLEQMCGAIGKAGNYRTVWIGYADKAADGMVRPAASWGLGKELLTDVRISWGKPEEAAGQPGAAVRRGTAIVSCDTHGGDQPYPELARRQGCASCLALPIMVDMAVIGALFICAAEPDAFGDEEERILSEAASDLSYGIAVMRAREREKALESSLQSRDAHYRAAADASMDALFILKSLPDDAGQVVDFEIVELNRHAEILLNRAREEIIGHTICDWYPVTRVAGLFEAYIHVAAGGKPLEQEFRIDRPDSTVTWLRQQIVPVDDGISVSSRDVTEWKESTQAARENAQRFSAAFEHAAIGMALVASDGRFMQVNRSLCAMIGYAEPELLARTFQDITHPDDLELDQAAARKLFAGEIDHYHMEKRYLHKLGQEVWVRLSASVVRDQQGKALYGDCPGRGRYRGSTRRRSAEKDRKATFRGAAHCPRRQLDVEHRRRYFGVVGRTVPDSWP